MWTMQSIHKFEYCHIFIPQSNFSEAVKLECCPRFLLCWVVTLFTILTQYTCWSSIWYLTATPLAASVMVLLLITAERYHSVMNPYYNPETVSKTLKYGLLVAVWCISIIAMLVAPLLWTRRTDRAIIVSGELLTTVVKADQMNSPEFVM